MNQRNRQAQGQRGQQGGGGRAPTHRIIAKPDRDESARYEEIGAGWVSERGGISLRFNRFANLQEIVRSGAHVMVVTVDDDRGAEGGGGYDDGSPAPTDGDFR